MSLFPVSLKTREKISVVLGSIILFCYFIAIPILAMYGAVLYTHEKAEMRATEGGITGTCFIDSVDLPRLSWVSTGPAAYECNSLLKVRYHPLMYGAPHAQQWQHISPCTAGLDITGIQVGTSVPCWSRDFAGGATAVVIKRYAHNEDTRKGFLGALIYLIPAPFIIFALIFCSLRTNKVEPVKEIPN